MYVSMHKIEEKIKTRMKRNVDDLLACQQESQRKRRKWYAGQKTIKTSEVIFYVRNNKKDSEDCILLREDVALFEIQHEFL